MSIRILLVTISCLTILSGCQTTQCPTPSWHNDTITVEGMGLMPTTGTIEQKKILAKRASKIDALHKLTQHISKLPVDKSRVSDYIPKGWAPGGFTIKSVVFQQNKAITTVSMPLYKIWNIVSQKCNENIAK